MGERLECASNQSASRRGSDAGDLAEKIVLGTVSAVAAYIFLMLPYSPRSEPVIETESELADALFFGIGSLVVLISTSVIAFGVSRLAQKKASWLLRIFALVLLGGGMVPLVRALYLLFTAPY